MMTNEFEHPEPKIHLYHNQRGATIGISNRKFANTLCRMNSSVPSNRIVSSPKLVTCKICRRDARFPKTPSPASELLSAPPLQREGRQTRYRVNWRGKLILQVEVTHTNAGVGAAFWRDATLRDLDVGVV
jgi:hypothetical protein